MQSVRTICQPLLLILLLLAVPKLCHAQWVTQTITLRPGWNAVFLEVQPEPREPALVFSGIPVESVWRWNRRFSAVQYIQDVNTLLAPSPDWLIYFPAGHPMNSQSDLFAVDGGRTYLIKLPDGGNNITWQVKGRARPRMPEWVADSFNLVGFGLTTNTPPTFQTFFQGSVAQSNQPIYRLNATGKWTLISNPSSTQMQRGEAVWVMSKGISDYTGTLRVTLPQSDRLDFGRILQEQTIKLKNMTAATRTVTVRELSSETPSNTNYPALAGRVPLGFWQNDFANNRVGWTNFPTQWQTNLLAGAEVELRLEVRRREMASAILPPGFSAAEYQSLFEITDGASRIVVPVTAEGLTTATSASLLPGIGVSAITVPQSRPGLWVGNASIKNVSQPGSFNPTNPLPVAAEFSFRILVHVNTNGQARLLQKVLEMWKAGTYKPDPEEPGKQIVDQPGRFVLVADDTLLPSFGGAAMRDGQLVGRRFSTAAFAFRQPLVMSGIGPFGSGGGEFTASVALGYDDPLNPFKHVYHPDHNNLDARFEQKIPEGRESFTVTRQVRLQFSDTDPDGLAIPGWGDNQVGGVYRETIVGLHRDAIHLQGTFRLHQASRVGVLNDQN